MRIAYFDCFSGASGDMILGSLLDAGLSLDVLKSELAKLRLPGWEITLGRRVRSGISAADVDMRCDDDAPERGFIEIRDIIEQSDLGSSVKEKAIRVFRRLGEAEAKVHDTTLDRIHFHEVGAIDCIIDICGACIGLESLEIRRIIASPLPQGHGFVRCAHGRMPVPTPATVELLRGCPVYSVDVEGELVTPTGAALLSSLADEWGPMPSMIPEVIGYGSGKKDFSPRPNLLRVVIGDMSSPMASSVSTDTVAVLETNLDDMNPEGYDWVMNRLFAAGALDATLTPIQMKKGRPGVTVSVIAPVEKQDAMTEILFRETSTFGVRSTHWQREILDREWMDVQTPYGPIPIKVGRRRGEIMTASPEYEKCREAAENNGFPLKTVYAAALAAFHELRLS